MAAPQGELQAALERLQRAPPPPAAAAAAFGSTVCTGSGFAGSSRVAIRELCAAAGVAYSGDLVRGHTTHLVLAPGAAAGASRKLQKAAEWGVPSVRLAWLLDSVAAARPLPVQPYLLDCFEPAEQQAPPPASHRQQQQQQQQQAASCRQLQPRHRPSSVASNKPPGAGGGSGGPAAGAAPQEQLAAGAGGPAGAQEQQATHQQLWQQEQRAALSPVNSMLADRLRCMSISPEPPPALPQHGAPSHQQRPRSRLSEMAPAPRQPTPGGDSTLPPPSGGSPQHSLSLQGMVDAEPQPEGQESPPEVAGGMQQQHQHGLPGGAGQEEGWSPMLLESPADAMQQQQQQRRQSGSSAGDGASPVTFSLAAALGRSLSDESGAQGSPMAESPAAPPAGEHAGGAGAASPGAVAATPAHGGSAGVPGAGGGEGEQEWALPTPACIRDWSDDDSSPGCTATGRGHAPAPDDASPGLEGISQTPPAVQQAIAQAAGPTQHPPSPLQQQQQQQPQGRAAAVAVQAAPAAEMDDSDGETVASDLPEPGDLVIADSESEGEAPALPPDQPPAQRMQHVQPAHSAQPQQQQPMPQPVHPAAPRPQKKGLLLVSRPSVAGQPAAAQRSPAAAQPMPSGQPAPRAAEAGAAGAAGPSAGEDEPMPSPSGEWEPADVAEPCASGSGDTSPAGSSRLHGGGGGSMAGCLVEEDGMQLSVGQPPRQQPAASSSASPDVHAPHGATRRRDAGGKQQQLSVVAAPQRRAVSSVRDWSESSSDDEFPTPTGNNRPKGRGGLTGLTQMDPTSIVIARPKPSASTAVRGAGGGGSQGSVVGLKMLQRPPRGNAVREHHGLPNLKTVQFAEQVEVASAGGLLLSTKKKTAVRLLPGGLTESEEEDEAFRPGSAHSGRRSSASSRGGTPAAAPAAAAEAEAEPVLGEPQTFYRLADGSWWLEYCRFYSAEQAEAAAAARGLALALPQGFDRACELLKAMGREYAPMADVAGGIQVRHVKQGASTLRLKGGTASAATRSYFWRLALDTASWRVFTDRAAADFVSID